MKARAARLVVIRGAALRALACLALLQFIIAGLGAGLVREVQTSESCVTAHSAVNAPDHKAPAPASPHAHDAGCCILNLVDTTPTIIDTIIDFLTPRAASTALSKGPDIEAAIREKPERGSLAPRAPPVARRDATRIHNA